MLLLVFIQGNENPKGDRTMHHLHQTRVSRRSFMRLSALSAAGAAVAACTGTVPAAPPSAPEAAAPAPAAQQAPASPPSQFQEAPMLAERVASGALPPVTERLPATPLVAQGLDGIGNYGGTWRMGFQGQADDYAAGQVLVRGLLDFTPDLEVIPALAESWEVNDDATEFTFYLRKGLKWSDGEPLDAEDFLYWYNDYQRNPDLSPAISEWLTSVVDGERVPLEMSSPDAYTIKYTFASPKALFYLDYGIATDLPAQPAHYMQQFHQAYADAATLEQAVADAGLDSWAELYFQKDNARLNPERPTHEPWIQINPYTDELVTFERNPYYWAVDPEGNQLPYIDKLSFRVFQDPDVYALWSVNGEIDCQSRHTRSSDLTVLRENEANGDYTVQLWRWVAVLGIHFNLTAKDARRRELFQARDFRIAVSLGIDRDEINELVYNGLGASMQYGPPAESPLHYPKLTNAYIDYDPDRANELLDNLGYSERDGEGFRLWKDGSGERIGWTVLGAPDAGDDTLIIVDSMKALGFDVNYRGVDRSLRIESHHSNDVECTTGFMDRNLVPLADPSIWVKHIGIDDRAWANAWTAWRMNPELPIAEEPPADHWIRTIWSLWDEINATADEATRNDLFLQILDIWSEELPSIGLIGEVPRLVIVKNGFKGIHAGYGWDCCAGVYEQIIDNSTWYWDDPSQHM
jgi:peptide/nickel transport system substrate-binding protein